jgi:hypothetical protein
MRAKELKRCLSSQSQVFSGLDESKADKLTLELSWVVFTVWMRARGARPIPSCFHNRMRAKELKRCLSSQSQVFSGLDESKVDKLTLKPILGCFHSLDESQMCSCYTGLFSQLDESKRDEKTLELVIHRNKSKRVANTLELVLSRIIQTWMEIKSIQDYNEQESIKEA